jgi:hypothetical protein
MKHEITSQKVLSFVFLATAIAILGAAGSSFAGSRDGVGGYKFKVDDQGGGGITSTSGGNQTAEKEATRVEIAPELLQGSSELNMGALEQLMLRFIVSMSIVR